MAYNSDGLSLLNDSLSGGGARIWCYDSADAFTDVRQADYFDDALERGMKEGDFIHVRTWTSWTDKYTYAGPITNYQLSFVIAVDEDGADLADGQEIDNTNTD